MTDYALLCEQLSALIGDERDQTANLANASALIRDALEGVNWVGFYLYKDGELVLGPFQGRPACVRIKKGRGVCGTAFTLDAVQLVPDVHAFPGHIACDEASRAEIVIPLHDKAARPVAVLDIDSPVYGRFDEDDLEGLKRVAAILEKLVFFS